MIESAVTRSLVDMVHNICKIKTILENSGNANNLGISLNNMLAKAIVRTHQLKSTLDKKSLSMIKNDIASVKYYHTLLEQL